MKSLFFKIVFGVCIYQQIIGYLCGQVYKFMTVASNTIMVFSKPTYPFRHILSHHLSFHE